MSDPVLNGLFDTTWYNGKNITSDQMGFVLFENKIVGLPRLRQLRVCRSDARARVTSSELCRSRSKTIPALFIRNFAR